jgi:hypothetical protein
MRGNLIIFIWLDVQGYELDRIKHETNRTIIAYMREEINF